ncbi:MAG TPA: nucleotidyltransferase domain-containing protein, partial [Chlamydiales bacterium]|nr:nucleotidyltransferase domain-containing protein [Chlamydiales bacterium]
MTYGLTLHELEIILEILQKYPQIEKAILFGSRAMRKEKKGSDVDIALKGSKLTETIFEVSRELNEESPLPYYFDIIDY